MSTGVRSAAGRTIDTGGAGPVTALLQAVRMIKNEALEVVAIVAADCVGSMDGGEFLEEADGIFRKLQPVRSRTVESPAIPHGYGAVTEYQMRTYGVTRDQLRMAVCLQSLHAGLRSDSLYYQKAVRGSRWTGEALPSILYTSLEEVRRAPPIAPNISLPECARRADGAACVILASNRFLRRRGLYQPGLPTFIGGGEASGPLYPPDEIDESMFSCEEAMSYAFSEAGILSHEDIDFFCLYDCFPVCLVRALEAAGLCQKGQGGVYLEEQYLRMTAALSRGADGLERLLQDETYVPINTHGGLLCYGAPWEVPAMYNIVEAVRQLRGESTGRQIKNC